MVPWLPVPAAATSRSISACCTAIGFGCWKKGCGASCGDDEKDETPQMRDARQLPEQWSAGRSRRGRTEPDTSQSCVRRESDTLRSPVTASTFAGSAAAYALECSGGLALNG